MDWLWVYLYLGLGFFLSIFTRPCGCGKWKYSVFLWKTHFKLRYLILEAVIDFFMVVGMYITDQPLWVRGVWILCFILDLVRIYYHEKDKLKKAAKALGRVVVLANGRLGISNT